MEHGAGEIGDPKVNGEKVLMGERCGEGNFQPY